MRRALTALALVLLLTVFLFEGALHSVHHLDDEERAAECVAAAAAGHTSVAGSAPVAFDHVPAATTWVAADAAPQPLPVRSLGVSEARAPPPALSV